MPCAPAHRPVSHCCMTSLIIGDPTALNEALRWRQPFGVGANDSGITIRSFQEHCPELPATREKVLDASAFPLPNRPTSALWSLQLVGMPPCPGTITSEHACFWSQPRKEFSRLVSMSMLAWPVPAVVVIAYWVLGMPADPKATARPPLLAR